MHPQIFLAGVFFSENWGIHLFLSTIKRFGVKKSSWAKVVLFAISERKNRKISVVKGKIWGFFQFFTPKIYSNQNGVNSRYRWEHKPRRTKKKWSKSEQPLLSYARDTRHTHRHTDRQTRAIFVVYDKLTSSTMQRIAGSDLTASQVSFWKFLREAAPSAIKAAFVQQ